jgi:hypothetical protein
MFLLGLTACETMVDLEVPREDPNLVINSQFWPDTEFELCVSDARDLIDGEGSMRAIEDAKVELLENGKLLEVVPYVGDCLYRSPKSRPVPGREYTVRASAEGYLDVEAVDPAPEPVRVEFDYELDDVHTEPIDVTITLHDPLQIENWYRLMVLYRHTDPAGYRETWYPAPGFKTDDEAIISEAQDYIEFEDDGEFETAFFSDKLLDHGPAGHAIRLKVPPPFLLDESDLIDLIVILDNVSYNLHQYATSHRLYREVGDNPFSEPVHVWTNVENGFGIFGGFNRKALDRRIR